jgi:ABC-2 type transport system ATP-binding protein
VSVPIVDATVRGDRPVVELRGLVKHFRAITAVDGLDLAVPAGARVGLLGPNGAGKTTTLLMLLGVILPDAGTVHLVGRELPRQRSKALEHVGFVAGYLPLPENLTVRESLEIFAGFYGIRRPGPVVSAAIDRFGIGALANRRGQELSSGQRTLVGIAKAVLHRPRLLVLDEPTASLDPDVALRVRAALLEVHREDGTALLVTSHNMREVEMLCERVVILARGRIAADGTPTEIATHFGTADLEGAFLEVAGQVVPEGGPGPSSPEAWAGPSSPEAWAGPSSPEAWAGP